MSLDILESTRETLIQAFNGENENDNWIVYSGYSVYYANKDNVRITIGNPKIQNCHQIPQANSPQKSKDTPTGYCSKSHYYSHRSSETKFQLEQPPGFQMFQIRFFLPSANSSTNVKASLDKLM